MQGKVVFQILFTSIAGGFENLTHRRSRNIKVGREMLVLEWEQDAVLIALSLAKPDSDVESTYVTVRADHLLQSSDKNDKSSPTADKSTEQVVVIGDFSFLGLVVLCSGASAVELTPIRVPRRRASQLR